tara:strand:+ start:198 stop:371 length:174 start_codon:yes stop_codon:yes gene_type:complete
MPQKETDLLRDPVGIAQTRYREQVQAFKDQYIPKPTRAEFNEWARSHGFRPEVLLRR